MADGGPQPPRPGPSTDGAGERARRILSGPHYRPGGTSPSLVDRLRKWIDRHLPKLHHAGPSHTQQSAFSWIVLVVVVVGALVALVWFLVHLRGGRRLADEPPAEPEVEVIPLLSTDEWAREAERLEAAGEWRAAMRARYRSAIGVLIDRDLLADIPGRTPGEFRVELSDTLPKAGDEFGQATAMFEAAWFGHADTGPDDVASFRQLVDAVTAEARS